MPRREEFMDNSCGLACESVDRAWLAEVVLAATGPDGSPREKQAATAAAANLFLRGHRDGERVAILLKRPAMAFLDRTEGGSGRN
jgi:hypothetical protein